MVNPHKNYILQITTDHIHKLNISFKQKHNSYKNILILGLVLLHCRPFKIHIYDKFQIQLT